ncbi:DNA helicase RecQ [Mucilaginibacter polytrichastri]|uniref:DNA helicase RecQ n=1 Tax=Mucilaginibacter polytrichastri TaxID=1302689 RepID=A0A1Q6A546_9SPHI|nr:DNA helicase RecQ [Mucilaginibacter polytrichastri]OKS89134.1 ATP-dependent DNA helicase recQ [Mucilaginibacter polytrichastri]SFS96949.1 ATP-dependent DNA helicase RecQ [Mucilaginibacter polytrichastri]
MTPLEALHKYFGYTEFRHQQGAIVQQILNGGDALVLMPTGGGKSLCYQLPAVLMDGLTVVISPLIALMKDQVDALNINGIPAAFLNSSLNANEQQSIISRLKSGEIKLLYLAPERLFGSENRLVTFLKTLNVSLIAIDEAHCISHWGHDFRPEYLMLSSFKTEFPKTPVIALTATADDLTRKDIREKLALHQPKEFVSSFNRPNISYKVSPKKDSYNQLLNFLDDHQEDSGIIYCLSRQSTEDLAADLQKQGYAAKAYHAGLDNETKAHNQDQFLRDEIKIMVATIAFGMGINKSNVRYVIHHDLPKNIEGYYQETGRAGRDGLPSEALLFFSAGDAFKLQRFARVEGNEDQSRIMLKKLDDMVKYCQLQTCRRQYLMHYFNEQFPDHCGSCDVCLTEFKKFDGTVIAQKALSAVYRLNQRFGTNYVIDFLRGSKSEKIRDEHKQLKTYGIGADLSKAEWQRYMGQLAIQGYLVVTDDQYPILKLTATSEAVLKGLQKVEFNLAEDLETAATETQPTIYEAGLLHDLKTTRFNLAMNENVPAYIILSDATLLEMATYLPQSTEELGRISGFGEVKLQRYGTAFLKVITAYCSQHGLASKIGIKKPKITKTKTTRASTGGTQRESFDLYKAGVGITEIAGMRNLSPMTVEGHLCSFIQSGEMEVTDLVDQQKIPKIQDAVESYGADRLAPLKEILGDDYSYTEIKAVVSWMKKEA